MELVWTHQEAESSSVPTDPHASLIVEAEPSWLPALSLNGNHLEVCLELLFPWEIAHPSRALEREAGTLGAAKLNRSCFAAY